MAKNKAVEINDDQPSIALVNQDADLKSVINEEAFFNEPVTIRVATTTDVNQPPYVHVNVNGSNCVIPRGMAVVVKRKYVEVLARMKETRYTQSTPNASEPDRIVMNAATGIVYNFEVLEDKNPLGREWFNRVMNEPA
jgi:hypothetical protein